MSLKHTKSRAGFSLVELMVVVAIIGILATIAVPNFQRFQAKAIQSNAKVELSAAFTAEKAFYAEYATYHSNFPAIGFVPEGFSFANATTAVPTLAAGVRRYYSVYSIAGDNPVTLASLNLAGRTGWLGGYKAATAVCAAPGASDTAQSAAVSIQQASFTLGAEGCPSKASQTTAEMDVWTIDDSKNLVNTQTGI
ncbi:MAG: type II secretion system protein [Bdellovibrionales bacterium]|nr:type II secretion system protein [Bdellovibrionales bacterium]